MNAKATMPGSMSPAGILLMEDAVKLYWIVQKRVMCSKTRSRCVRLLSVFYLSLRPLFVRGGMSSVDFGWQGLVSSVDTPGCLSKVRVRRWHFLCKGPYIP